MKTHITSTLLLAAGLLAFASGGASADTKVFQAASICTGGKQSNFNINGTIFNDSLTLPVTVLCAINRDRTDAKPSSVQISVIDNSSLLIGDGNFACSLLPMSRFGQPNASGATVTTSGTNSAGQILTVPIPAFVPNDGTLTLKCKIPRRGAGDPNSLIGSIKVVEPEPTN